MRKFLYLSVLGVAATSLALTVPSESRADHRPGSNLSIGVGTGGFHFDYNRGHAPVLPPRGYVVPGYTGYYGPAYGPVYGPRPVVVQPTESHWTPGRGWHTHGQILVPHGGHYHVRPY